MTAWFVIAFSCFGAAATKEGTQASIEKDFRVDLPGEKRPLPEPLPQSRSAPSFAFRGTKGWLWRPEQYLAEIRTLVKVKMNFLMNCYGSMCDIEHHRWGTPECNRWWEPLPAEKRRAYEQVVRSCQEHKIHFCFSMNPNLFAKRFVRGDDPKGLDQLWQHYAWMQGLGVRWFSICLDDIRRGIDAADQAKVVNEIFRRLRAEDPDAQMIFCPTFYWGTAKRTAAKAYLSVLAERLHPEAYVFWTGPRVVTSTIARDEAKAYKGVVRHRLFVWDNYPVNDAHPTLHLGPVTGRNPKLAEVVDGYMANPLCQQNEINRIPLMTMADFAYNAPAYDPSRSIGQAILHSAEATDHRRVLADLVELYPGMLVYGKGTNWNPVLERFKGIVAEPHQRFLARLYVEHVADVVQRMKMAFPDRFVPTRKTVTEDVAKLQAEFEKRYGP